MKRNNIFYFLLLFSFPLLGQNGINKIAFNLTPSLVAIQVANIDSSINWYKKMLGFSETDKKEFSDYGMKIAFMKLNGFELELVENKKSIARTKILKDYPKESEIQGFAKLAFRVSDIETADSHLKKMGAKYLYNLRKSNISSKPNQRFLIVSDADGNWVQLLFE
ncbi:MAG: hypothetical protein C0412_12840 [Flavobacterium sp.]|nr:hypothetical protein [Flavobacterium sp.]